MKKKKRSKPLKSVSSFSIGNKTSVDNKLSLMQIHLDHLFEKGVNFKERIICITDTIEHPTFDYVDAALTEMESENRKTITIKINSEICLWGNGNWNETKKS